MKLFGISARAAAEETAQTRVDSIVAAARRHAPPPAEKPRPVRVLPPPQVDPSTSKLDLRIEEELHYVRRMIEALGDTLCEDAILVHRHATALQSIDIVTQTLGHLANVVGAADRGAAVDRIGMYELKSRLQRRADHLSAPQGLNRTESNPFSQH